MKLRIIFLGNLRSLAVPKLFISALAVYCTHTTSGVTLQTVLRTSLERNPAILEAKSALEGAAGQRLVFRSVAWPDAELGVPAGVQAGHRAGENGVKGFAVGRGTLIHTLFNAGVISTLRLDVTHLVL